MSFTLRSFLVAFALCFSALFATAQEPVATGIVMGYQPKAGTVTLRSDQTNGLITFYGAAKSNIFTTDGKAATLGDLQLGTRVTLYFATRKDHWYISRIILPPAMPMPRGIPVNAQPSNSRASITANDGNITTSADAHHGRVETVKRR